MKHYIAIVLICITFISSKCENPKTEMENKTDEIVTLGAGCFWCVEAIFQSLAGVSKVESGYSGGKVKNPSYKEICSGMTNHAEVVQITYDPNKISFEQLLEVFFQTHDPTTLNRQGADVGTQYRSVIFYHNEKQKNISTKIIYDLNKINAYPSPIVTKVTPFDTFYKAENYHQDYYINNINQPYCKMVIQPKLTKFKKTFEKYLKK